MPCQQTISELIGVTTTAVESDLTGQCCALTGSIGSEIMEEPVVPDPSPQDYLGSCSAPA